MEKLKVLEQVLLHDYNDLPLERILNSDDALLQFEIAKRYKMHMNLVNRDKPCDVSLYKFGSIVSICGLIFAAWI